MDEAFRISDDKNPILAIIHFNGSIKKSLNSGLYIHV